MKNRKIRMITTVILAGAMAMSAAACKDGKKADETEEETVAETSAEPSLDMEQAMRDLDDYCSRHPVCLRASSDEYPEQNIVYDFTGDGNDDLMTEFTFGSGLVRDMIVVYDVANEVFYPVGGDEASYTIESFEDGELTVQEYIYTDGYRMGTLEFENDQFVFVANSER